MPGRRPSDASRSPGAVLRRFLTGLAQHASDARDVVDLGEVNAHLVVRTEAGAVTATIHGWTGDRATTVQVPLLPRTVAGWCPSCRAVYRWALDRGPRKKALCAACFGRLKAVPRNVEVEGAGPVVSPVGPPRSLAATDAV